MEPRLRKTSSTKTSDMPSPVLLRRRLSAPETVMRKYNLARARSQESDPGQSSDSKFSQLSYDSHSGSDLNLQKKKDSAVLMRKSTLLRRLMNNPKSLGSSSFQEWQHYCGKLSTPSLNSLQGSPEHLSKSYSRRSLVGYEFKTSPKHSYSSRKVSPAHQLQESHKKSMTVVNTSPKRCDSYENQQSYYSHSTNSKTTSMSSQKTNDLQVTTLGGHSDSAYSNDRSNFSPVSITSCSTNTNLTKKSSRYTKVHENLPNHFDQRIVDENRNFSVDTSFNYVTQETSTQTSSTTNLNVISNVELSQTTLDLIVNEVMRDVQKSYTNGNEVQEKTGDSVHVRKISGLFAKSNGILTNNCKDDVLEQKKNLEMYDPPRMASRLSAMSSKTSIGVISENFTDDNSDIVSLADSLEDTTSSKISLKNHDNKPVRGDLPPLPTNGQKHSKKNFRPADAFFISMKTEIEKGTKSVSDYLPKKLKEKIAKRQHDLKDKLNQTKTSLISTFTPMTLKESKKGLITKSEKSDDSKQREVRKKARYKKPFLPSIEATKKFKMENTEKKSEKSKNKNRLKKKSNQSTKNPDVLDSKHKFTEKHFRLYTTENEYVYDDGPKRIYHKAEFRNNNKRIEILEIMECVDLSEKNSQNATRVKSKIPVLVSQKSSRISDHVPKNPTYLDFDKVVIPDPKLDQLLANILIQSLNEDESACYGKSNHVSDTGKSDDIDHRQTFESILEELSQQSSNEDNENFSTHINSTKKTSVDGMRENELRKNDNFIKKEVPEKSFNNNHCNERATFESSEAEKLPKLPDGWVAFYMPQKTEGSPEYSSTEGRKPVTQNIEPDDERRFAKPADSSFASEQLRKYRTLHEKVHEEYDFERTATNEKEDFERVITSPPVAKRYGQSSRKPRYRNVSNSQHPPGEWSIVLSGTNNASFASDLEMKIRFPSTNQTESVPPQLRTGVEEDRENNQVYEGRTRFPRIHEKYLNTFSDKYTIYDGSNGELRRLPDIKKKREAETQQASDPIESYKAMKIVDMKPRQTKTSLRRYNMTRPTLHPLFESNIYDFRVGRQCPEILRRFPQLLSVSGNSISPERKYIPGMNSRDIPKHNCTNQGI